MNDIATKGIGLMGTIALATSSSVEAKFTAKSAPTNVRELERDASFRIIGGVRAPQDRYPYMASLETPSRSHICGGSLVARDFIITAAHCKEDFKYISVGQYDRRSNHASTEDFDISKHFQHELYDPTTYAYDYLLVKLSGKSTHEPVRLNVNRNVPEDNQELTVMGWGVDNVNSKTSVPVLSTATVNYERNEECKQSQSSQSSFSYEPYLRDHMMCAWDHGEDSCQGDSGGPLISEGSSASEDELVGIVSWGFSCADPNFPGVYTRISHVHEWIQDVICEHSDSPPPYMNCIQKDDRVDIDENPNNTPSAVQVDASYPLEEPAFPIIIEITLDEYPEEIGWSFHRISSQAEEVYTVRRGTYKVPSETITETIMVYEGGLYHFEIFDLVGDGMCCQHGKGGYKIYLDDDLHVSTSGNFNFKSEQAFIAQKAKSTPVPSGESFVTLDINFDLFPSENGWILETEHIDEEYDVVDTAKSGGAADSSLQVIGYQLPGTYSPELAHKKIRETIVVPDAREGDFRTYTFTFLDSAGDGICCTYGKGNYTLYMRHPQDDVIILQGDSFQKQRESQSFAISGNMAIPADLSGESSAGYTTIGKTTGVWMTTLLATTFVLLWSGFI
eukprot:CAMPEP_0195294664 /NCGR_PEP_ID=MMETSP0707-20130614/15666_1 /TAXON_ID=33640 /ORGANISM="Asterionellopsis glacialis, Strain CCMP134" /LENGTH=617 /DNA_ID=CAMNT_0040355701 /DNA_START=142 /DNA_END=1995 /DNA_ORIENTATION=+